jgi:PTS system nitrogen regulatory IIA component
MNLSDLIRPADVIVALRVRDKAQLLGELARQAAARCDAAGPAILAALSARERLGSTGLGRGFALPHARVDGVERLLGLFVRLARPIDFEAIDDEPVDVIFLLLIGPRADDDHVAALAAVAREMRGDGALRDARAAADAPALYRRFTAGPSSFPPAASG